MLFRSSEDTLPGGAKELVEKGVLENPHVDAIYGMHAKGPLSTDGNRAPECKRISGPNCEDDGPSSNESWS